MKAAVLRGNENLCYDEYPEPQLRPGHIKVRVKAAGICGSDIPRVLRNGAHSYPIVLGHEFAGEVAEIARDVTGFAINDRVSGAPLLPCMRCEDCLRGQYALCKHYSFIGSRQQGAFAEYVVLPAQNAVKYNPAISFEQGAMFEPSTVALHGVLLNRYEGGGRVAILGGGTIGLFAMQWANIFGAAETTVFDLDDDRLALAKRLGAARVCNTKEENPDALQGQFDYVFETAGVTATMQLAYALAANRAKLCFIGTPTKDLVFTPKLWENMNRKEFTLTGSWMSYSAPFPGKEWNLTAHYFATGQLKFDPALLFKTVPLAQAAEMFALYKTPGAVKGKIMLLP
ncbi:MAG: galactitol-1-phosphate 5-dehydrogenase [Oscillospiraceae bacterium]|jgi:L-iditol 2-dehydrogenase|nr:galactitol-1-phosphate 5-dehydrogenase [Oscillospiraceae bacterium]